MNQWDGIEAHDKYKDKLTGCCQEGQVHHTLSERMSTDAKVWSENGIDEMSQLRAFTQNNGDIYQKIIDISTKEKREKKIEEQEKRIKKKKNKKLFGTGGPKIPIVQARDELYYELKKLWYGRTAVQVLQKIKRSDKLKKNLAIGLLIELKNKQKNDKNIKFKKKISNSAFQKILLIL